MAPSCKCKCMKPGRLTRNAYLNYLREFRKKHCGLSAVEVVRKGAEKWRTMSQKDKAKYIEMARHAPKGSKRCRCRANARRKPSARSRKSCGRSRRFRK